MTALGSSGIRGIFAAIKTAPVPLRHIQPTPARPGPHFVTISREGGAGGHTIGQLLVNRLNALDPAAEPWTLWDRALVEKISADHKIAQDVLASLEESGRTWLEDFLAGLSMDSDQTEAKLYGLVCATIRILAHTGRVVIVGRGGVYITRNMPGGVHLRLVAPIAHRAHYMARQLNLTYDQAMAHVRTIDRQRRKFYRRYWPNQVQTPEAFTLTINTAQVPEERAVECALPLILPDAQIIRGEHVPAMSSM